MVINGYFQVFFFDVLRKLTVRFEDNTLFRATFSCIPHQIIAISRNIKSNQYKILVLDIKKTNSQALKTIEISPQNFPNFANFYVCNVFQAERNLTIIAGVEFEPGKKQMSLGCPHVIYVIKGEILTGNLQIRKLNLFNSAGYSELFLESGLCLPFFRFIYLEDR